MPGARQGGKRGRKTGRNKRKPAAMRYKSEDRLRKRKVKHIMNDAGVTRAVATQQWDDSGK